MAVTLQEQTLALVAELDHALIDVERDNPQLFLAVNNFNAVSLRVQEMELAQRHSMLSAGVQGNNEAARETNIKVALMVHPVLSQLRDDLTAARVERDRCQCNVDVADARQKIRRAQLAALVALLGGEKEKAY